MEIIKRYRFIIFTFVLSFFVSTSVYANNNNYSWSNNATAIAIGKGLVYVTKDNSKTPTDAEYQNEINDSEKGENDKSENNTTFYFYAKAESGYQFTGWSETDNGAIIDYTAEKYTRSLTATKSSPETKLELYAHFVNKYSVIFNGNGNTSGSMSQQQFVYGSPQPLSPNEFARSYSITYDPNGGSLSNTTQSASAEFKGWATSITGDKVYDNQQEVNNLTKEGDGEITLYAVWELPKIDLYTPTPQTGYEFVGWYSENTKIEPTGYELSHNLNLTASYRTVFKFEATAFSYNDALGTATANVNEKILGEVDETSKTTTATFIASPCADCVFKGWYETSTYEGNPVSTDLTYDVILTNSTIGSTTSKTLYALFKKKQNLQWTDADLDLNLVNGHDYSTAATVTSDKNITYTSSNQNAVTIETNGTIHAVGLGDSRVTASVPGDEVYQEETIERVFSVGEIKQATFTPAWGEGTSPDIKVDGSTSVALTNIANDETFTISATPEGIIRWNREGNTLNISAVQAGTTTLTLTQTGNASLAGNQVAYTITVSKYANTFALAEETKAMKVDDVWENVVTDYGNGNTTVSYSVEDVATYDSETNKITALAEGSTVITFAQEATANNDGTSKSINVTVTKVVNTLSVTLGSTEVDADGTINLIVAGRVSDGATHAYISDMQLSSEVNNGTDVITYASDVITACNAGTAKIKFTQDATNKYTAYESETYTITVNKLSNAITVTLDGEQKNSKNVGRGATVALGITSSSDASYDINRTSGSDDIATISANTIHVGSTDGTNVWEISQAETYKYEAATTSVRIKVNSVPEEEGYVFTGWTGNGQTWSGMNDNCDFELSGVPQTLSFDARKSGTDGITVYISIDGNNWTQLKTFSAQYSLSDNSMSHHEVEINNESVRYVRIRCTNSIHHLHDVKVTRKTYVRATASQTDLGEVYTDKTASTTFNVSYSSTNGGNIEILSNNPRFTVDTESISVNKVKAKAPDLLADTQAITVTDNSDNVSAPVVVKVTYTPDPDHLGDDAGTITISDRYYSAELTFTAFAKKYPTTISRGSNATTETTVDGTIDNAFAFTGTSDSAPSASSDDDFYYTIANSYTSDVHTEEGVITYDPATNTITGRNAGTARLTIYQKSTNLYAATSQTFDFTVSKLANPVNIALSTNSIDVDGTATVALTNDDGKGAVSVAYGNIAYTNESLNREGGLLRYDEESKTLTGVNAGTAIVTVTQAETHKYLSKSQQFTVTVNKLPQTLTWDREVETTMQVGAVITGNTATSGQELTPVTYTSSNTAAIEVDAESGQLTAKAVGANITITASQAGNYKYAPAAITRQFSVFNKQTPTFSPDEDHYNSEIKTITVEWEGTATITVTGVGADAETRFTITNSDETKISVERSESIITITGLAIGEGIQLTLAQEASDDFIAKSETYTINVVMPTDYLVLDSSVEPSSTKGTYRKVFLTRTFKAGYNTLALPFNTTVEKLTGRSNSEDWVAQLSIVTWNTKDGYTLFFQKVDGGVITANEPYILHLANAVENPQWTETTVEAAEAKTKEATRGYSEYAQWVMHANYSLNYDMKDKYGIVNTESNQGGLLMLGADGSTLSPYSAYITSPATSANKVRSAFVDQTTDINALTWSDTDEIEAVYNASGMLMGKQMRNGLNIVRMKNGEVKKLWVK